MQACGEKQLQPASVVTAGVCLSQEAAPGKTQDEREGRVANI
jgi:hypothetical protein